jgi:hypothetical protein
MGISSNNEEGEMNNDPRLEDLEPRPENSEPPDPENSLYEQHKREHEKEEG